jgi:hypothetical protein
MMWMQVSVVTAMSEWRTMLHVDRCGQQAQPSALGGAPLIQAPF